MKKKEGVRKEGGRHKQYSFYFLISIAIKKCHNTKSAIKFTKSISMKMVIKVGVPKME